MPRGEVDVTKVHYKGQDEDFIVFVESSGAVKKWKEDKTVPLVDVVNAFEVFVTHKQGAQGRLDKASKSQLENEFGTKSEDAAIQAILEKGDIQDVTNPGRGGDRNDTMSQRQAH